MGARGGAVRCAKRSASLSVRQPAAGAGGRAPLRSAQLSTAPSAPDRTPPTGRPANSEEGLKRKPNLTTNQLCSGPHPDPGARPGVGARRRAPGGRVFAHGTRPGSARNGDVGPPSSRLTTRRKVHEGPVQCGLGSSRGGGPRRPNPWTKTLAIGTWNVTSLGGKEPELVREVERYRLEIVGLTSTHSLGSGTQLLERGWTLHYSGVAQGERRRGWCGLAYSSPAQPPCVGVHSGEREGRFPAPWGWG
ncbi:hypothetical protein L3Q82_002468 [Scortum barcoo]|uniref:Uncharacterized protein n=1 Tax=Scortum barcoo TaxID=214431 RepID=A0ACB8VYT1_9TELE|nr:hypothetical protein L3Q82_002468 [Scortum barcoo]